MDEFKSYLSFLENMDDPYILCGGFALGMLGLIVFYFMYFYNREESSFDTDVSPEYLAILVDKDKKKVTSPKNTGNKNKKKQQKTTPDATEDEREKREVPTAAAAVASAPGPIHVQTTAPAQSAPSQKSKVSPPKQQPQAAHPQQHQHQHQQAPKESPPLPQQQQQQQQQQQEPPKKKAIKPVKDLDQKKVISRLTGIADLEDGYVQWITAALRDNEAQKNNLSNEVKAWQRKTTEATQKVEKLTKEKSNGEQREKNEQTARTQLQTKLQTLQARETDLLRQVQTSQSTLHTRDQDHAKELQTVRTKTQQLENDITTLKSGSSRISAQLRNAQQQNRDTQNKLDAETKRFKQELAAKEATFKNANESLEGLTEIIELAEKRCAEAGKDLADKQSRIRQLEAQNAELEDALSATRLALDNQSKHQTDNSSETNALKEEKAAWLTEKQQMYVKYEELEKLMKELNKDIADFHEYCSKRQQEVIVGELTQRDKSRVDELEKTREEFRVKEDTLHKEILQGKLWIAEMSQKLKEEDARVVEIEKNSPEPKQEEPPVVEEEKEEVFELKKVGTDLAAAASPSTSSNGDNDDEKDAKIAELRQRNMTILQKVEAQPELLITDRKRVATLMSKATGKKFKAFDDEEAFHNWLADSVSALESTSSSNAEVTQQATCSAQKIPAGKEAECERALVDLREQLDRIAELALKSEEAAKSSNA